MQSAIDTLPHTLLGFSVALALIVLTLTAEPAFAESSGSVPKKLTPAWIEEQLRIHDTRSVIDQLWNQNRFDEVTDQISAGNSEWIALAPRLVGGTDAGASEELSLSLAYALPLNADAVLATLNPTSATLSPSSICSAPFIEDTTTDIPDYLSRSIKAVETNPNPDLSKSKADCLAELHKTLVIVQTNDSQ